MNRTVHVLSEQLALPSPSPFYNLRLYLLCY